MTGVISNLSFSGDDLGLGYIAVISFVEVVGRKSDAIGSWVRGKVLFFELLQRMVLLVNLCILALNYLG